MFLMQGRAGGQQPRPQQAVMGDGKPGLIQLYHHLPLAAAVKSEDKPKPRWGERGLIPARVGHP